MADEVPANPSHPTDRMTLTELYLHAKAQFDTPAQAEEAEERAREAAVAVIITGGFDQGDSDLAGDEMGGTVKTLLMVAFMRQPEMADAMSELMVSDED